MGYNFGVLTDELKQLASGLRTSGEEVRKQVTPVNNNLFGTGAEAGQHYSNEGKAVHAGLERISRWLQNWSEGSLSMADAVGASVVKVSNTTDEHARDFKAIENKI